MLEAIPMSNSRTIQTRLVLPPDTNHMNTVFGGKILAYIDEIAAITSMKHAKMQTVTASFDSVDFISPVRSGDILELEGVVSTTGRSSMEIYIRVSARNIETNERRLTTESFVTMVAVDSEGTPQSVAPVFPETNEESRLFESGPMRRDHRRAKREMPHSFF
ncbi:acyl-CoA thioesterase [Kurthia sibirica]|uniref:Acyl-CoA thioesterase n=1 Tax=Kurthia sibirica TaxID=202750 RepID=A0A2U3AM97_9BACL|nr:acyl-CoA thioesterase [Kurthia sibirica]PWI25661.1 acyl-CoA thioesterase [Kurthia sibirica]GEK33666.1 acyl-CoA thioesterase [Kurthia sibirica]